MFENSDDGTQELVEALSLHLAAGREAKNFKASGFEQELTGTQPIDIDLSYDSVNQAIIGKAAWELTFPFTRYIEVVSLAINDGSSPPTAMSGIVRVGGDVKAVSKFVFNAALLAKLPAKMTFEVRLFVLGPAMELHNQATLNL